MGGGLKAQITSAGSWDVAFNHQYLTVRSKPAGPTEPLPPGLTHYPFGENPLPQDPFSSGLDPTQKQFNASHATLIPAGPYRGQVLVWEGDAAYRTGRFVPGFTRWSIVDPIQDPNATSGVMFRNYYVDLGGAANGTLFCTGGAWNGEGVFFITGGSTTPPPQFGGSRLALTFAPADFDAAAWVQDWGMWRRQTGDFLFAPRWYPTSLFIGQGQQRTLSLGGWQQSPAVNQNYESHQVMTPAVTPYETWGNPPNRLFKGPVFGNFPAFWDFPRTTLLSSGKAFLSGKDAGAARLTHTPNSDASWAEWPAGNPIYATAWTSSVLMPNLGQQFDWVMRVCRVDGSALDYRRVEMCNAAASPVAWSSAQLPQLAIPRAHPSAVLLPDASVLVLNGEGGVPRPELLRLRDLGVPGLQWLQGDDSTAFGGARNYHSCAVLLPDARVFVTGGEARTKDHAIFRPYYLSLGPRPTIVSAPAQMQYSGLNYAFDTGSAGFGTAATRIVLIRPGMSTHHSDMLQRYVELQMTAVNEIVGGVQLVVKPPASQNHAPPGDYMAFAVTDVGVPSVAAWVRLVP